MFDRRVLCVAGVLAACALTPQASVADDPNSAAAAHSDPDPPADADLLEYLGSVDTEGQDWMEYLDQTDTAKAVKVKNPPASAGDDPQ